MLNTWSSKIKRYVIMNMPYLLKNETKLLLQVRRDLEEDEGFREFAYPDPLSPLYKKYPKLKNKWGYQPVRELVPENEDLSKGAPWTVGHGFTDGTTPDSRISRIQSERKLDEKILAMNKVLERVLPWYEKAPFVTRTVLINMAFNMGVEGLLGFKNTLKYMGQGNYSQAATNMKKSLWYRQVGRRAQYLSERIRTQTIAAEHKAPEKL